MLSGTARDREHPATFRDVLVIGEFRAIYAASTLSWVGDYIARAAITALVFKSTGSVVASAAAFAISYAPWLLGGSVLVSLAERYPYRNVMVLCDVGRMLIMTTVALIPLPLPVVLILLLCSALFAPPFDAARSAMLPSLLPGDRYVVGLAMHTATAQPAQVAGYFAGAALVAVNPRLALLINAATFVASALLVRFGVRLRPPALQPERRSHLLNETVQGFRLVFSSRALRSIVLLVFCGSIFAVVPEGLGAAWAAGLADESSRGWAQGLIMGAIPLGAILGALTVTRLVSPDTRRRLLRPLAILIPLALFPTIFNPPVFSVAVLAGLSGFALGALVPIANGQFVQALPNAYRARAFGVVQGGLQVLQGGAVLVTGTLSNLSQGSRLPMVVGLWSLAGVGLMLLLSAFWPAPQVFAEAVHAAAVANAAQSSSYAARHSADPGADDTDPAMSGAAGAEGRAEAGEQSAPRQRARLKPNGWAPRRGSVTGTARTQATSSQPGTMEP
jgi:hypothetical protein